MTPTGEAARRVTLLDIASARQTDTKYHRMVSAVCSTFGVRPAHMTSPLRTRKIARPRQIIMYLATTDLGLSTTVVGRLLGGRDHSTVIHGRDTIAGMVEVNSVMRQRVEAIRRNCETRVE